jgi:hypothetical protein
VKNKTNRFVKIKLIFFSKIPILKIDIKMDFDTKCPGYYCGRMPLPNDTFSDCGSCDRGWKRNDKYICVQCNDKLELYDLLFLAFNIIVPFLIHLFLIDYTTKTPKK